MGEGREAPGGSGEGETGRPGRWDGAGSAVREAAGSSDWDLSQGWGPHTQKGPGR